MFHAAELECGHEEEIELAERIRDTGVAFEPIERRRVQVENRVAVASHFLRVGFTMDHSEGTAVALSLLDEEPASREREEARGDGSRFGEGEPRAATARGSRGLGAVRNRFPAGGHVQGERPAAFEVRLIETGKGLVGPGWDEDRVEEVIAPVERRIAGVEIERDGVYPGAQRGGREEDVPVDQRRFERAPPTSIRCRPPI
jgi:hypothetical protein